MRAFTVVLSLVAAGLVAQAFAQQAQQAKRPEAKVATVTEAPKVDGTLDDAAWKQATEITEFRTSEGGQPRVKTRLLLARDDKTLYVAIENFEDADKLKRLVADIVDRDGEGIWEDDSVELFIDPTNRRKAYYHVIVNAKGVTWDSVNRPEESDMGDTTWNPNLEVATRVGQESWVVELAIPFEAFDRTVASNPEWAMNVLRNRVALDGGYDHLYWSPTGGSAHQPDKFGTVANMPEWKDRQVTKRLED
jgi:hypothetical protein